jgi:hypothetical protein
MHDSILSGKRRWIQKEKRSVVTVIGSRSKTIVFEVLFADGKQPFGSKTGLTAIPLLHTLGK